MKKFLSIFLLTIVFNLPSAVSFASGNSPENKPTSKPEPRSEQATTLRSSKADLFEYETDEDDASESLNRVAGTIDRGYSSPEQSFKSPDHYKPGPFGRQEAADEGADSRY